MEVLENIKKVIQLLNETEQYHEDLNGAGGLMSIIDQKIDYWLHQIEFNDYDARKICRIHKEIKRLRNQRRRYKRDDDLLRIFKTNVQKLCNQQNREFLLIEMCKKDNYHQQATYGSTIYSQEEINEILGIKESDIHD